MFAVSPKDPVVFATYACTRSTEFFPLLLTLAVADKWYVTETFVQPESSTSEKMSVELTPSATDQELAPAIMRWLAGKSLSPALVLIKFFPTVVYCHVSPLDSKPQDTMTLPKPAFAMNVAVNVQEPSKKRMKSRKLVG